MKDYRNSNFYFTIENNNAFIGAKFLFDDLSNVFDIEYNPHLKKLQSNIATRIKVPEGLSKNEAISLLGEMVEKTWRRKKITFAAFIKNKDSFLSDGKGGFKDTNRVFDNKISFLDVVNYFGKENVKLYSNFFNENYEAISNVIVDKLVETYQKRYKYSLKKAPFLEEARKKEKKAGRIEAKKEELSSSYIYMKYYNFIKDNFFLNGIPFKAHIPLLDKLSLHFFENVISDKEKNEESYKTAALRSRFIYEGATGNLLVPKGKKNIFFVEPVIKKHNAKRYKWSNNAKTWLIPNEKYINLYLNYIFPHLLKIYSDKDKGKNDNKLWSGYEIYKFKKINTNKIQLEEPLRLEMTCIKQILLNPIFKQLFRFPYVEGRLFLRQYFEYITYVIGRICYRSTILPLEFIEEEKNFIKRYFQHSYWSTRYKFDEVFEKNFKYDFGDISFETLNFEMTNEKFSVEDYVTLKYPSDEEYQREEDELFQLDKIEIYENGKSIIKRKDIFFNGNFEETVLTKFFRNSPEPESFVINLEEIKKTGYKNKKTLLSTLLKEAKEVYNKKIETKQTANLVEPEDPFGIIKHLQEKVKERSLIQMPILTANEKTFYLFLKKIKEAEKEKIRLENQQNSEKFMKNKVEKFPSFLEKMETLEKEENFKNREETIIKTNEENEKQIPQDYFEQIMYKQFENLMQGNVVERELQDRDGNPEKWEFYAINIFDYNIDMKKPNIQSIVKSVIFKPIIEELRPFIVGKINKDGKIEKKTIRLNDMETINKILEFKYEQTKLLIQKREKEYNKILENFNETYYNSLLEKARIRIEQFTAEDVKAEKIAQMEKNFKENYTAFIEQKHKELMKKIEKINKTLLPSAIKKEEEKNKNYSINFIVKNIRKQETEQKKKNEAAAIFLEDIHNMIKFYSPFYFKKGKENIYEKFQENEVILEQTKEKIQKFNETLVPINKEYLFINVFLKLINKFTFAIPFLRAYSENITDQFVSFAFADNIDNALSFVNGAVFNAANLNILKSKYKLFRNHPEIKKEVIFKGPSGKMEKKNLNYNEYLALKYSKDVTVHKKNPFEITPENVALYEGLDNSIKFHRILGENVKYLYTNINIENEIIIYSKLFSNYEEFIIQMLLLDRMINFAWNERGKNDVDFKNYRVHERTVDVYVKGEFKGRMKLNIESTNDTYSTENIYEKIRKILKGSE